MIGVRTEVRGLTGFTRNVFREYAGSFIDLEK